MSVIENPSPAGSPHLDSPILSASPSKDNGEPPLQPSSSYKSEMRSVDEEVLVTPGPDRPDPVYEPITVRSMTEVIEALKSEALQVIDGEYHLRGLITADEAKKFRAYAHSVTEVVLNDAKGATIEKTVAVETWLRLLQLQTLHSQTPAIFFPSLRRLTIDGCSGVWDLGMLFLTPSLQTITVSRIPAGQSGAFLTFLHSLAENAPHLSRISCDKTCTMNSFAGILTSFTHLQTVNIAVNSKATVTKQILRDIGRLPVLEYLILDASRSVYVDADVSQDSVAVATPVDASAMVPSLPDSNMTESSVDGLSVANAGLGYLQLHTLKVYGPLKLLEDVVAMVGSRMIVLTLIKVKEKRTYAPAAPENLQNLVEAILCKEWQHVESIRLYSRWNTVSTVSLKDLQRMMCLPSLRDMIVSGPFMQVNYADGFAPFPDCPSKLKSLHLPINKTPNQGIDFAQLRQIADGFPSLVSLKCEFKPYSHVPPLPNFRTFGLKTLATGCFPEVSDNTEWGQEVAQYLDAMFPELQTMTVPTDCYFDTQWFNIFHFIRMCQRSRKHHTAVNKSGE